MSFTVVTDKGSHLPIPMPKKKTGVGRGWRGAVEEGRKGFLEITARRRLPPPKAAYERSAPGLNKERAERGPQGP